MGDHDGGDTELIEELEELSAQLLAQPRIEIAERLIQ